MPNLNVFQICLLALILPHHVLIYVMHLCYYGYHLLPLQYTPTLHTGTQIVISNKWGFTKWPKEQYSKMREEGKLLPDGVNVQYYPDHGPLQHWRNRQE